MFKIQWPDCPYPVVLNTETKEYISSVHAVRTVHPYTKGNITWSRRFREVLEQIDSNFVLFFLEDYFILNPVNVTVFEHAVEVMQKDGRVGAIVLAQREDDGEGIKTSEYEDDLFYSRKIDSKNKVWCRTVLYRKEYLLKLIRDFETVWNFEWYVCYRAKRMKYMMLQQNNAADEVFTFSVKVENGIGITRNKWLQGNVELFAKYGIPVNFQELGFLDLEDSAMKSSDQVQEGPKMNVREFLYRIKWFVKQVKKKVLKVRHYF